MGSTTQWPGNAQTLRARQQEVEVLMQAHSTKRRTKAKGRPGVYFREVGGRRRYEISYLDETGTRRWKTVPGFDNLEQAQAQLVEVKTKLNRGERVAPSKLTFDEAADLWFAGKNVGRADAGALRVEPASLPATALRPTARVGDHGR